MGKMTEEKAREIYHGGIDCSQLTFAHGCELMGINPEMGYKIGACFGGGMFHGETCGCVTGCLMAIGMKYGHYRMNDLQAKAVLMKIKEKFEQAFIDEYDSLICRDLLGYNPGNPEELEIIRSQGLMDIICPKLAVKACSILDEIFTENNELNNLG